MGDRSCCNDDSMGIVCVLPIYHRGPHAYPLTDALRVLDSGRREREPESDPYQGDTGPR